MSWGSAGEMKTHRLPERPYLPLYPVAELRMSEFKNKRIEWNPEHVIVHHAVQKLTANLYHGLSRPTIFLLEP